MDTVRGAAGVGEPFREIVDAEVVEDYQPRHARPPSSYVCPQCGPDPDGPEAHTEAHHTIDGIMGRIVPYPGRHRRD